MEDEKYPSSFLILPFCFRYRCAQTCDEKELKLITDIKTQIKDKENVFFDMEAYLPKKNGWELLVVSERSAVITKLYFVNLHFFSVLRLYLNLVLGNVNVTLLSNQAKYVSPFSLKSRFRLWVQIGFYVSLLSSLCSVYALRFAYKDEYEKFKLCMTIILMFGAITCLFFLNCRWENLPPLEAWLMVLSY